MRRGAGGSELNKFRGSGAASASNGSSGVGSAAARTPKEW